MKARRPAARRPRDPGREPASAARNADGPTAMRRLGGVPAIRLGHLESQYRPAQTHPDIAAIAETLAEMVDSGADVDEVEAYRSQLPGLKLHPSILDADPRLLRVELAWRLIR